MSIAPALAVALVFPVGFAFGIRSLDLYGTGKLRNNMLALVWGMTACFLADFVQSRFVANGWMIQGQLPGVVAPIDEELLKAGILVYLVSRADFNYVVDGAIYGFGAGIGFAMIENCLYLLRPQDNAMILAISRLLSANLIHASASAVIGSALAAGRIERDVKKSIYAGIGLLFAIGIHMLYNNMVLAGTRVLVAVAAGLASAGVIIIIIKGSLRIEQGWIAERLGMMDRVTAGEAAVVQRIQSVDEVLDPIARRFGLEKAALTASLLYLQAEIGIKYKLIEMTADPGQRVLIEGAMRQRKAEMESVRKEIGSYCMLFVRSVYLSGRIQLWELINQRMREAGAGAAGDGLWSRLDERIKSSKPRDEDS